MDYQPKFKIGQTVHYVGDPADIVGEVVLIQQAQDGFRYTISSEDVDVQARKLVKGVKAGLLESELEEVSDVAEETVTEEEAK